MTGLRAVLAIAVAVLMLARGAMAQDVAYIQIEAQPSLARAETRLRAYTSTLEDVNGFALGAGWYGIALGPYPRDTAERRLDALVLQGLIPRDSYIAPPNEYRDRFWPIGAQPTVLIPAEDPLTPPVAPTPDLTTPAVTQPTPQPVPQPEPQPDPGETRAEARASERQLTRSDREGLQIALKWAGHYRSSIDAAFGPGTRRAMRAWQEANAYEPTGILTTRQRAQLLRQYNAVLEGLDLGPVTDTRAGIRIDMPRGVVRFDRYESPFAQYNATSDLGVRVLLISQPGDRNTLNGLYEIMQTLEIVPRTGPRSKKRDSFRLVGENDRIISHTEASLKNGQIKGFTLVWPAGDEERRGRVLTQMQRSFTREAGVLDSAILDDTAPTVNLVAGLRVRTPRLTRTGFFVAQNGTVVTSVDAVAGCARVTLDRDFDAQVVAQDTASGLAVVRAQGGLAPVGRAELARTQPRRSLEIAVAGYPYGAVLNAPTLTFGRVADVTGLSGEPDLMRLDMDALPGDAGGPIIDRSGAVVGVLLPEADTMRRLPAGVSLAANTNALRALLDQAGVRPNTSQRGTDLPPEDLSILVRDLTVLVNCWDS